jgi:type I restriction enzyme S subunit
LVKREFIPHENKALSVDDKNPAELALQSGDVLVTRSNTPELVGDACIVPSNFPSLLIPDLIYRLRLRRDLIEPEYLSSFLITPAARTQIRRDARGSSGSMVKVSQEHLLNWLIPVPPPIEQRAILEYLARERTRTAELEDALHRSIALLKERRSALITAAVTGQLAPEAMSA